MPVARLLYTLLLVAATPLAALFLLWRSRRHTGYRRHWAERFAGALPAPQAASAERPLIWIHAVSVGETRAAQPLVEALLEQRPDLRILLTHGTPTGREMGVALFGDRVARGYLPYDLPWAVAAFLDRQRPALGLLIETEVWPNLVAGCLARGVPLCLVNARLSERSRRGYARLRALAEPAFAGLARVVAQTVADAERLSGLGARDVRIVGNLKSDADPDPQQMALGASWRAAWHAADAQAGVEPRLIWLAASTREGEDGPVIEACRHLAALTPGALLVWVPRHPHRVADIERLLDAAGLTHSRRSLTTAPAPGTAVWIGDSLGELAAYISAADVVFMGGSLAELGGQNLLEPLALGKPVLVGPHTFNFMELTREAVETGAALRVSDGQSLGDALAQLLGDGARRSAMAHLALELRQRHRGSLERTLVALVDLLPQSGLTPVSPGSGPSLKGTR